MKIKSIHLKNFRQFIDETIEFSTDNDKNITLIKGHNSGGKTTLANAISWCLFGTYKFKDEAGDVRLVNELVWKNSRPNTIIPVTVSLNVVYAGTTYEIETTREYQTSTGISADSKLRVQPKGNLKREIRFVEDDDTYILEGVDAETKIAEIFPKGLSDYIILRAESLDDMVKNLGKKDTKLFREAVNKILGLESAEKMKELILETQKQISVSYRKSANDDEINRLQQEINDLQQEFEKNKKNRDDQQSLMDIAQDTINKETTIIKQGESGQVLQTNIDHANSKYNDYKTKQELNKKSIYEKFSRCIVRHLYKALLPDLIEWLDSAKNDLNSEQNISSMYINGLTRETIDAILDSGICICGNPIIEGSKEWNLLKERIKFVPPESLGVLITQFKNNVVEKQESFDSLEKTLPEWYQMYVETDNECSAEMKKLKQKIDDLQEQLEGHTDIRENIRRRAQADINYKEAKEERDKFQQEMNRIIRVKQQTETSLSTAEEKSMGNKILKKKKHLIDAVASVCLKINQNNKEKLKELLNKHVNDFFTETFSDDYKIVITPDYSIKLYTKDDEPIGAGGAQDVSTILAFITSLLKLAQQIHYNKLQCLECNTLMTEPYPLVLDAPFSYFDEERTSIVSPKLSGLTEQVIIFSKDPECQLIMNNAKDKIGKFYKLKFETRDEDGKKQVWSTNIIEGEE